MFRQPDIGNSIQSLRRKIWCKISFLFWSCPIRAYSNDGQGSSSPRKNHAKIEGMAQYKVLFTEHHFIYLCREVGGAGKNILGCFCFSNEKIQRLEALASSLSTCARAMVNAALPFIYTRSPSCELLYNQCSPSADSLFLVTRKGNPHVVCFSSPNPEFCSRNPVFCPLLDMASVFMYVLFKPQPN